jgi:glutamate racemase
MDNRPIGVFDSGVGGLTVVSALLQNIPGETIYYVGDTARVPYGNKSQERIQKYSKEIVDWLIQEDCKMIIVACNTASSLAINYLKSKFSLPIIGVIDPGVNKALSVTKTQTIGVIGTHATIRSDSYGNRLKSINPKIKILNKACPLFVPLVEEGLLKGKIPNLIAESYLSDFNDKDVDTVILGCTHYPILKKTIKNILGEGINLVDSGEATAKVVLESLGENKILSDSPVGKLYSFVTDSTESFKKAIIKSFSPSIGIVAGPIKRIDLH